MPKRFKFRFSGVIPTFQFCRPSKHPSDLPSDPFLSFLHQLSSLPPCLRLRSAAHSSDLKWTKSDNWHVFDPDLPRRKIYNSAASSSDDEERAEITPLPLPLPPPKGKRRSRIRRKKKPYGTVRLSLSSGESGLFSDDDEEEIGAEFETLVSNSNSSRSFSTDSSTEFSPHLETIREGPAIRPKKHKKKRTKNRMKVKIGGRRWPDAAAADVEEEFAAARLSAVFRRLVPCAAAGVEGKVRESLAVVKRSEEPYEDFKNSMVEMIVEKEMVEEKDLQELLRCFLSLNSEQHHGIIIRAFDDICRALFFSQSSCLV